eukprot:7103846-Pyramimonas_sp.AAC.1
MLVTRFLIELVRFVRCSSGTNPQTNSKDTKVHPMGETPGVVEARRSEPDVVDLTKGKNWLPTGVHEDVSEVEAVYLHPRFASGSVVSRADLVPCPAVL